MSVVFHSEWINSLLLILFPKVFGLSAGIWQPGSLFAERVCLLSFPLKCCRTSPLSHRGSCFWNSSLSVYRRRGRVRRGGVIWLGEVTMRYGGEEGRLFDTATRWGCAVMYNGNTSELAESRMACTEHTHTHTHAYAANCTQIEPTGFPSTIWATKRKPACVLGIKVSVWSQRA